MVVCTLQDIKPGNREFLRSWEKDDYEPFKYVELEIIGSLNPKMLYHQN